MTAVTPRGLRTHGLSDGAVAKSARASRGPASATSVGLCDDAALFVRRVSIGAATIVVTVILMSAAPSASVREIVPAFMLVLALHFAPALWIKDPDLFSPLVFTSLTNGLAWVASLAAFFYAGEVRLRWVDPIDAGQEMDLVFRVLLVLAVSQLAYLAGYFLPLGDHTVRWFPRVAGLRWKRGRLLALSVVATAVAIACYGYFQSRLGVPLFDVTELARGKAVWRDDPTLSWMWRGIQLGLVPLLLFSMVCLRRKSLMQRGLAATIVILAAILVMRLGQRGPAFQFGLAFVTLYHYLRRRVRLSTFVLAWFFAIVMLNVLGDLRLGETSVSNRSLAERALSPLESIAQHSEDRQRFTAIAVVLNSFPARHQFLFGATWGGLLVTPIPRWIWPEKQGFFPWYNGIVFNFTGESIPDSYPATLYANFSWIGVILGMALLGVVHHGAYAWLRLHPRDQSVVLLYILFVLFFGLTGLGINSFLTYFVPSWLAVRLIGTRIPGRLRASRRQTPRMSVAWPGTFAGRSGLLRRGRGKL